MNGYLIKATYLSGRNIGKSYFLRKGGYVTTPNASQWDDTVYKTLGIAKAQCKKLYTKNEKNIFGENLERDYRTRMKKFVSPTRIYEKMSYEPFEVQNVHPDRLDR